MVPERLKDSLKIVAIHDEAEVTTVEADLTVTVTCPNV